MFVFWAMIATNDVALRMLSANLMVAMLVFRLNVLAALPVSVAFIIGARINASALKK